MHPIMLSTWSFGPIGNTPGMKAMLAGASSLDAVEIAAAAVEDDPGVHSVGLGGLPDASGRVSLDGCIMTGPSRCGSVAFVRHYANPVSIARRVMEKTIHVMLVGEGAEDFAAREGFARRELLTEHARAEWDKWRSDPANLDRERYRGWVPPRNVEERTKGGSGGRGGGSVGKGRASDLYHDAGWSHDTVSILAADRDGRLAGACSTSGMAFKLPGRVGDSPIIGHGLYVDDRVGGAAATGNGELVMGTCTSFLAVELMRRGASPRDAAVEALGRVVSSFDLHADHQVAMIVMGAGDGGERPWASAAIRPGFHHTISDEGGMRVEPAQHVLIP